MSTSPGGTIGANGREVRAARCGAALSRTELYALVEIGGDDCRSFLQAQLPIDIAALTARRCLATAYLDRRGRITHPLILFDSGRSIAVLVPPELCATLLEKFAHYRMRAEVTLEDRSAECAVLELHGPATEAVLAACGGETLFLPDPWTGAPGGHLIVPRRSHEALAEALLARGAALGLASIGSEALEILRIEAGLPRWGVDCDERTLLPELGREEMFSTAKGCYLGQETIARIHAHGRVNRVLKRVEIDGERLPQPGTPLLHRGETAGRITSAAFSPGLQRVVALAMVRRIATEPGAELRVAIEGELTSARVRPLPARRPAL